MTQCCGSTQPQRTLLTVDIIHLYLIALDTETRILVYSHASSSDAQFDHADNYVFNTFCILYTLNQMFFCFVGLLYIFSPDCVT